MAESDTDSIFPSRLSGLALTKSDIDALELLIAVELSGKTIGSAVRPADVIDKCAGQGNLRLSQHDRTTLINLFHAWLEIQSRKARAKKGDIEAMLSLGEIYMRSGTYVTDEEQAAHWYEKAALAGNAEGMFRLGLIYLVGEKAGNNPEKARRWLENAAKTGHSDAMFGLASMYAGELGGMPRDDGKARYWCEKAAALGHARAQATLRAWRSGKNETAPASSNCFIATAACGSAEDPDVARLRYFRDNYLSKYRVGRNFIALYQNISPPLAARLANRPLERRLVRWLLIRPAARILLFNLQKKAPSKSSPSGLNS